MNIMHNGSGKKYQNSVPENQAKFQKKYLLSSA
jgi:hypothetical protein